MVRSLYDPLYKLLIVASVESSFISVYIMTYRHAFIDSLQRVEMTLPWWSTCAHMLTGLKRYGTSYYPLYASYYTPNRY